MKKIYEAPELEAIKYNTSDVLTTTQPKDNNDQLPFDPAKP